MILVTLIYRCLLKLSGITKKNIFDGIIFRSSQRPCGINYVLFGEIINTDDQKSKNKEYHVEFDRDQGVKFYQITKVFAKDEEV